MSPSPKLFDFLTFFWCLSSSPKQSSDVPMDAPSNLPTSKLTSLKNVRCLSRHWVGSEDFFQKVSNISVDAPSNLQMSQSTPQAIIRRPSGHFKKFPNISVDAERESSFDWASGKRTSSFWHLREIFCWPRRRCNRIFRHPSQCPKIISDVSVDATRNLPTSQWVQKRPLEVLKKSSDILVNALTRFPTLVNATSDLPMSQSATEKSASRRYFKHQIQYNFKNNYVDESFCTFFWAHQ